MKMDGRERKGHTLFFHGVEWGFNVFLLHIRLLL